MQSSGRGRRKNQNNLPKTWSPWPCRRGAEPACRSREGQTDHAGFYAVAPAPDGSVWGSSLGYPGAIIRLNPGPNPPETALAEYYELPVNEKGEPIEGFSPRRMDIDRNGVAWVALASGHMASFDRRKVKGPLNGPKATGQHACAVS